MRAASSILLIALAMIGGLLAVAWPRIQYYQMTGSFAPISKIETLHSPVAVDSWSEDGLKLADGRIVALPGIQRLPLTSTALREVTKRGVEFGTNGRIYGLVRVHHWCGNDPVREHIARVDISKMLLMLQVGQAISPVNEAITSSCRPGGQFSEFGWNASEFGMLQQMDILFQENY